MQSAQLRSTFIDFFAKNGHRKVNSGSLVPLDDPSILFTNAGMVQFKRIFTGEEKRDYNRAVTSQKCVRAGGKHNDLENVGYTARHHTFFEMLGNFSFGDYFKEQAIDLAWTLLTKDLGLPADRLYATIYQDDDEAHGYWKKVTGLPDERIIRLGEKDNFWAMGDTGPCGPCSEILIDQGEHLSCGRPDCGPGCDCDRYLEIWNLVFMQFERAPDGAMTKLPKPSIDTGMGLERLTAVMSGVLSNFETDLFIPLLAKISKLSSVPYVFDRSLTAKDAAFQTNVSLRVIADHARAVTFLIGDGVLPQNLGRGYVLRRILRRAVRHGRKIGLTKPFLDQMIDEVIGQMSPFYPELSENAAFIKKVASGEEERFIETLGTGLNILNEAIADIKKQKGSSVPGELTFKLYDTFGFPLDLVADVAREHFLTVDEAGFNAAMEDQKAKGRAAWKSQTLKSEELDAINSLTAAGFVQKFTGYDHLSQDSITPELLLLSGKPVESAGESDEVVLVFPTTPFYAASGGQEGDSGVISFPTGKVAVSEVVKAPGSGVFLHRGLVELGKIYSNQKALLTVDSERRAQTAANHTATHLLHLALRETLGPHVRQAGSSVSGDRMRFDFTHDQAMTDEEINKVERIVNHEITLDLPVTTSIMSSDQAIRSGAMALFEERYGEEVRVVSVGRSRELCGGTHTTSSGRLGLFLIESESAVAAGVRRLECVSGAVAVERVQSIRHSLKDVSLALKSKPEEALERVRKLFSRVRDLEKGVSQKSGPKSSDIAKNSQKINGLTVLATEVQADSPKRLREIADEIRGILGPEAILALGSASPDNKAMLLVTVGQNLTSRFRAGDLISIMAGYVGGRGGGKAELAQAGGPDIAGLPKALAAVRQAIEASETDKAS
ncbi:MAG: alanine--tRNA ligase [Deltaproteobacteria bacterium]|jgi:alanyl-tRNA synthetase|nr:alanine--tRNA ligase [Deltaproteobacteria bacterium]